MKGNLRYKDGAWRLRVNAGKDPATGKPIILYRTVKEPETRDGKRLAEDALARLVLGAGARRGLPNTSPTVEQWMASWQAREAPGWAPSTRAIRPGIIAKHIVAHLGPKRIGDLRRRDIAAWHQTLGATLAPGSVKGAHRVLHRALADAVELEVIDRNPATGVKVAGSSDTSVRPPTDAELDRILAALAADPQTATIVRLDAVLGARRGELCALRWTDLDLDDGTVTIARAISDGRGEGLVERQTKTNKVRTVGLDDATVAVLRAHRLRRLEQCMSIGARMDDAGFVFVGDKDLTGTKPLRPTLISRRFAAACARAEVSGVRFHDLRHYVASMLLRDGLDVRSTAEWLGHSPTMTLNRYGHFIPPENRSAAERLAARRKSG